MLDSGHAVDNARKIRLLCSICNYVTICENISRAGIPGQISVSSRTGDLKLSLPPLQTRQVDTLGEWCNFDRLRRSFRRVIDRSDNEPVRLLLRFSAINCAGDQF